MQILTLTIYVYVYTGMYVEIQVTELERAQGVIEHV